jgi:hypothetical protein
MNYQETINKIKALFDMAAPVMPDMAAPANPDVSGLADYILQDGTKISCDKLAIGGSVTINGTPAPDGDHTLQDGTIIQTKDGVIEEISSPAEEAQDQEVNTDMTAADMKTKMEEMTQHMADMKTKCAGYDGKFAEHQAAMTKQQEAIKMLTQMMEKMATMPVDKPAAMATNQFTTQKTENKDEMFQSMVEAMNKLKSN